MYKAFGYFFLFLVTVVSIVTQWTVTTGMTFTLTPDELETLTIKISEASSPFFRQNVNFERTSPPRQNSSSVFAVLVAGSRGYMNYRHQADVCHAYQILHRNGIPDENIVVMMYDDIALHPDNPTQGVILNRPNGTNVYDGVLKDYVGKDVNPDTFFKVLLGDEEGVKGVGSGKVLKSGPGDHVFINFVDHGAPGLIAFPTEELHARDLEKVLLQMHKYKKYKKLVFYLEACESGSMFQNILPAHLNILATTASNSVESSFACYYDERRRTYLGDVYSVMWMENSEQVNLEMETLQNQFLLVKNETNTSHVSEFGDRSLQKLPVSDFLGYSPELLSYPPAELDPVDSRDVPRVLLEKKISGTRNLKERKELELKLSRLYKMRTLVRTQFMQIIDKVTVNDIQERTLILRSRLPLINYTCYESVAKYYSAHCFSIAKNPYVMRKLYLFVNLCERGWSSESMIEAMASTCRQEESGTYSVIY